MHSHQQWIGVPDACHAHQHLVLSVVWIFAILIGVQWHLIVVLIGNSLVIYDIELYLFKWLLAICITSLARCLLRSFLHFKTILKVVLRVLCIFWYLYQISDISFANYFSSSLWFAFSFSSHNLTLKNSKQYPHPFDISNLFQRGTQCQQFGKLASSTLTMYLYS